MRPLLDRIRREGPLPFSTFLEVALYDPEQGFFGRGGGAGRADADFVTSPETGPLFGVVVARALDRFWTELGSPDPFVVVEAGAARGRLAREILRAEPACAPALRYVLVERSVALREAQRELLTVEPFEDALGPATPGEPGEEPVAVPRTGPVVTAIDALPSVHLDGVVLANELLDDLPFDVVERTPEGWSEVRVGHDDADHLVEVMLPASDELAAHVDALTAGVPVPSGCRLPVQHGVASWLGECATALRHGFVVLLDYMASVDELVARGPLGWLRTYRAHQRGGDPLDAPGSQDVTADVALEVVRRGAARAGFRVVRETTQAAWLAEHGIDGLVDAGRRVWHERAAVGDLEALAARSRVSEAAALTDPDGLGAHTVVVLATGQPGGGMAAGESRPRREDP